MSNKLVQSKDYLGIVNQLVHKDSGSVVLEGDEVTTQDGEVYTVTGGRAPHKIGSSGRVWVKSADHTAEYYPGVFDLEWVDAGLQDEPKEEL